MMRMERKHHAGDKPVMVFRRTFDEGPEVISVINQEDTVDVATLLLEDFTDFDFVTIVRKMRPNDAQRLKAVLMVEA